MSDKTRQIRSFCENVKKLRTRNNLTKTEMAKLLGISVYALSLLERGVLPHRMNCMVLYNIYDIFGVMPSEMLMEWSGE